MNNIILKTDSYKASHWKQYPPNTTKIYSYLESRGGKFSSTLFFGLQYIIKKHLQGIHVTKEGIEKAEIFYREHFGKELFNKEGWINMLNKYDGRLPIRIKAVPEGTVVPVSNVLMTIENTDDEFFWLTNYLETILMQVWYPITVATNSFECKKIIKKYLLETQGNIDSLFFKLQDFGFRGSSSYESSAIGGAANLVNFNGTDNIPGIILAMKYYHSKMCGFSIPASEHSTITSWGKDNEVDAFKNMLTSYPEGLVACVSDSYDIYNACDKLLGEILHDDIEKRKGTLVIRPDSGNPEEVISKVMDILWNKFGGDYNNLGFKVLNPCVRVIQGDGVDIDSIQQILQTLKNKHFSAENIAFGSGGALLQKFDRDTHQFAIKCSYAEIDGKPVNVFKDPSTSSSKKSKMGMLKLLKSAEYITTISSAKETKEMFSGYNDILETVFENGEIKKEYTFDEIKNTANTYCK